jgi:acetyl esterase
MNHLPGAESELDPEVLAAFPRYYPAPDPGASDPVAAARDRLERMAHIGPVAAQPVATEDDTIHGPDGPVAARVYTPAVSSGDTMLFFHGGGWVAGSIASHEKVCLALAADIAIRVISIEYRRAPEHRYPAAVEDAWAATLAAVGARRWRTSPARTAVAGDSAGANLAAVVARRARDAGISLLGQVLLYPVTDYRTDTESYRRFADGFGLTAEAMIAFWQAYLPEQGTEIDADLAPLRAMDLGGLAPAVVITAGCDVLRDEGEAYAERLAAAGVPVARRRYAGLPHGFLRMAGEVPSARNAFDDLTAIIRDHLHVGSTQVPAT